MRAEDDAAAASGIMDAVPQRLWLLHGSGRVAHVNTAARLWMERVTGWVCLRHGHLHQVGQLAETKWHALLEQALQGQLVEAGTWHEPSDGSLLVGLLRLLPLSEHHSLRRHWPRAVVLMALDVQEPAAFQSARRAALAQRFSLTHTEMRVLQALCGGATLDEIAVRHGVRTTTVRTHVTNMLDKTGTRRQVDLVRLASGF